MLANEGRGSSRRSPNSSRTTNSEALSPISSGSKKTAQSAKLKSPSELLKNAILQNEGNETSKSGAKLMKTVCYRPKLVTWPENIAKEDKPSSIQAQTTPQCRSERPGS
jgi:hypothetical protein